MSDKNRTFAQDGYEPALQKQTEGHTPKVMQKGYTPEVIPGSDLPTKLPAESSSVTRPQAQAKQTE